MEQPRPLIFFSLSEGLPQVDVHTVVADLQVTDEVESLAAELPPDFCEVCYAVAYSVPSQS